MFSFVSTSIATSIIPSISQNYADKKYDIVRNLIEKSLLFSILPGILITSILFNFSEEYMQLIFGTNIGSNYVKLFIFPFLLFYIEPPIISILQAIGKSKQLFIFSIISNITKLVLIFSLTFINKIFYHSLIIAMVLNSVLVTLTTLFYLKNIINLKFKSQKLISIIILIILILTTTYLLKLKINNFIIASIISGILSIIYIKILKLIDF